MYASQHLQGYASRSLRETEFHSRLLRAGLALDARPAWVDAPMRDEDGNLYIGRMPIMYPSVLAKALMDVGFLDLVIPPRCLALYWKQILLDFPEHPLHGREQQWERAIPVVLWGDEGTKGNNSWMLFSWKLGGMLSLFFDCLTLMFNVLFVSVVLLLLEKAANC